MQMLHSLAKSKQQLSRVLDQEPIWALSSVFRRNTWLSYKQRSYSSLPSPSQSSRWIKSANTKVIMWAVSVLLSHFCLTAGKLLLRRYHFRECQGTVASFVALEVSIHHRCSPQISLTSWRPFLSLRWGNYYFVLVHQLRYSQISPKQDYPM